MCARNNEKVEAAEKNAQPAERVSPNVNKNLFAAHLDSVALDAVSRLLGQLAGRYVVLPAMPRATHQRAVEVTLTERPSMVQAYTIDGKELAVNIGKRDGFPDDIQFADLPSRNFVDFGRTFKCHWFASPN